MGHLACIKVEKNVGGIEGLCVVEPAVHGDMQSTGKTYADHAATLRSWSARKKIQQKPGTGIPDYTYNEEESL